MRSVSSKMSHSCPTDIVKIVLWKNIKYYSIL
nr:MAG TPA: hypothetical protein [Caudoviricetes sp.]